MCGAAGQSGVVLGAVGQGRENVNLLPSKYQRLNVALEMPYRKKIAQKVEEKCKQSLRQSCEGNI